MSSTLATERDTMRQMVHNTDSANYVFSDSDVNRTLVNQGLQLSAEVGQGQTWVTSAFMLPTDGSDAQLPSAAGEQYEQVLKLKLPATGRVLRPASLAEIEMMRQGLQGPSGDPVYYALYEDATSKLFARFGNIPSQARQVDIFRAILPTVGYTDGTAFPFSNLLLTAIRKAAGAELVAKTAPDKVAILALGPGAVGTWLYDVKTLLELEARRQAQLERAGYGVGAIIG